MEKSYKMIVTDIDGTLLNDEHVVSAKNKEAIRKFIDAGNIFILASGRPTKGMWPIVDALEIASEDAYILSYNGSHLVNTQSRETTYEHNLTNEDFALIDAFAQEHDAAFCSYTEDALIVNKQSDEAEVEVTLTGLGYQIDADILAYFENKSKPKSIVFAEPEKLKKLEPLLKEHVNGTLEVFTSSPIFLEVMPKGVHKGAGIVELSKMFDIPIAEIIAVGDGGNDVGMIKQAGLGVAVSNAIKPLKDAADVETVSNNEHALAQVIEDYFGIV